LQLANDLIRSLNHFVRVQSNLTPVL